ITDRLSHDKILSVGIVDGRNVWRTDLAAARADLERVQNRIGSDRLMVGPACSLLHSPVTLRNEDRLDDTLKSWLAFAEEKLAEIVCLARAVDGKADPAMLDANARAMAARRDSTMIHNNDVQERVA